MFNSRVKEEGGGMKEKKCRVEKRKQADGSIILVQAGRIRESKYIPHSGKREAARRLRQIERRILKP